MLNENLLEKLNNQVNDEFGLSYTYLGMATYSESIELSGFANFFKSLAKEKISHGMNLYEYIFEKGGTVKLKSIEEPLVEFKDIIDVFEKGYEYEKNNTKKIYNLIDSTIEKKDYATLNLLDPFVNKQVEYEDTIKSLLNKVKRFSDNKTLNILDSKLADK